MDTGCFAGDSESEILISLRQSLWSQRPVFASACQSVFMSANPALMSSGQLYELIDSIIILLCTEPFDYDSAQEFGEQLFDICTGQPTLLGEVQLVISQTLVAHLATETALLLQLHISTFLSACTTGFITRMQETSFHTSQMTVTNELAEHYLSSLVAHQPLVLFTIDSNEVFTHATGKGLKLLSLSSHDLVGKTVTDVISAAEVMYYIRCALRGQRFTAMVEVNAVIFEVRYEPLYKANGEVSGVVGVARDVTRATHLEETVINLKHALSHRNMGSRSSETDLNMPLYEVQNDGTAHDSEQSNRTGHIGLNWREIEILRLVAQGMTNKEIARSLTISHTTVKWYLGNVYAKLGVRNRMSAVQYVQSIHIFE
ncbi:MAG: hypothetical protein GFH27_549307n206 [Chloroflexi bacterium AL-W]|nr:hypothetical protein [Chloroflexi bacterium AL-N1]NOK69239.1 hypothetical protein [Chloroflexi bacterium AL-N10]NOK77222.1 hypothetical protein [Chloroflexi bacterium AL-N5]NOK83866.1 hypothetical protein [Chloroflexi bacterium AL-W]NOK91077.1 hypothetical protein [Chloroflexi bacterium AL-N15]